MATLDDSMATLAAATTTTVTVTLSDSLSPLLPPAPQPHHRGPGGRIFRIRGHGGGQEGRQVAEGPVGLAPQWATWPGLMP